MNLSPSVNLAILNIQKEGVTDVDVFERPFEIDLLKGRDDFLKLKNNIKERIQSAIDVADSSGGGGEGMFDALKRLSVNQIGSILVPKKTLFDFRRCAYIEPLDEMVYLSLVMMISNHIEKARLKKSINKVFSYRLRNDLDGQEDPLYIFDSEYNYTKFRSFVSDRAKSDGVKVVASCDISNFYDRLNLHRLENTLYAIKGINKSVVKLINELLLYWSGRDSYGIPVGSNASRILAEASLINVDKFLFNKGIDFCRYVDDYRFFAKDASEAHSWLSILVERLSHEGLFLNTSKTTIAEAKKINETTSVDENSVVSSSESDSAVDHKVDKVDKGDIPRVISGYSGVIPTKFRSIGKEDVDKMKADDKYFFDKSMLENEVIEPKDFIKHVRIAVARELWSDFSDISNVLNKFPQFVPYYLDCVKKNSEHLSQDNKNLISRNMKGIIKNPSILEYLKIFLIRFFSSKEFLDKNLVMDCYSNLRRNEGVYLGRAILESIQEYVDREDVLRIKNDFIRADNSERRQIIKILKNNFNPNEFGAFYKNISLNKNDFLHEFISIS